MIILGAFKIGHSGRIRLCFAILSPPLEIYQVLLIHIQLGLFPPPPEECLNTVLVTVYRVSRDS